MDARGYFVLRFGIIGDKPLGGGHFNVGQNWNNNITLDSGSILILNSLVVSNKEFTAVFQNQSPTKCFIWCLEVTWIIPQDTDYQHRLCQTAFSFRGKVGCPTFNIFFFFFNFQNFIYNSHAFVFEIINLQRGNFFSYLCLLLEYLGHVQEILFILVFLFRGRWTILHILNCNFPWVFR